MVFDFIQFWLDGRPSNEYFWNSHKISDLLTPLTPLGVHPQCLLKMQSETDWSNSSQCVLSTKNSLWHYRLWSFKTKDTKLERFLHKNQPTQRKFLNFENWTKMGRSLSSLQKSEFLKLIILIFHEKNWKTSGN